MHKSGIQLIATFLAAGLSHVQVDVSDGRVLTVTHSTRRNRAEVNRFLVLRMNRIDRAAERANSQGAHALLVVRTPPLSG